MKKLIYIIGILAIFTSYSFSQNIDSGLVAWYPLNGTPNDSSGFNRHGVLIGGAAFGTDRFGNNNYCYVGNGTNSTINIPNGNFPIGNSTRSISLWFKMVLPFTGSAEQIFGWGNNTFGQRFSINYFPNRLGVEYVNGDVSFNFTADSTWHHFVVTYPANGQGSTSIKLYKDGILQTNLVNAPINGFNTIFDAHHHIGSLFGSIYVYLGKIDDIKVYNRELTQTEVTLLYSSVPPNLDSGIVASWPFNGNANDESGNGNHGTVYGATLTTDRFGNTNSAYSFNGSSNYILIPDNTNLRPTNISCVAWIYGNILSDNYRFVLAKNAGTGSGESVSMFFGNNRLNGLIGGPTFLGTWLNSQNAVSINQWHQLAYTYSDALNSHSLYIDGVSVNSGTENSSIIYDTKPWSIGTELENNAYSFFFDGKIDDIKIYNRKLTDLEIYLLYNLSSLVPNLISLQTIQLI